MTKQRKYNVYGVGNALVDSEYEIHDAFLETTGIKKGTMALIQREERLALMDKLEEHEHQVIKQSGGGSAANTIVAIAQFGGESFYTCKVASDHIGDFFLADLKKAGVDTNMPEDNSLREEGHTGECISMISPDAERTMATHLGITENVSPQDLNAAAIKNSDFLYIEGYLVSSEVSITAARAAQAIAKSANVKIALTLSDPAMVEFFRDNFDGLVGAGVDLIFCNKDEALLWTGADDVDGAVETLKKHCPTFVITLGAEGSIVYDGSLHTVEAVPTKAVDTTGAGDIFAGAFLYGITNGKSYVESADLGNKAASHLVSSFGARLSQAEIDKYLK